MRRMESVLWSAAVGDARPGGLGVSGGLNKVAADPTGAPIAPAVTVANRRGI